MARFACVPMGGFGVAVALIESEGPEAEKRALLALATTPRGGAVAGSVIDRAGRALARYGGRDVETALATVETGGAAYTVLFLHCQRLGRDAGIRHCAGVLGRHETPRAAHAAGILLERSGKAAIPAVEKVRAAARARGGKGVDGTIVARCQAILKRIAATH